MHCCAVAARIGRVGHRHRLDDDRRAAADLDGADAHADGLVKLDEWHAIISIIPAGSERVRAAAMLEAPAAELSASEGVDVLQLRRSRDRSDVRSASEAELDGCAGPWRDRHSQTDGIEPSDGHDDSTEFGCERSIAGGACAGGRRVPAAAADASRRPTSSGCRIRSTRRAPTCRGCAARDQTLAVAAADRARRPARRGRLPEGEAAQGRHASAAASTPTCATGSRTLRSRARGESASQPSGAAAAIREQQRRRQRIGSGSGVERHDGDPTTRRASTSHADRSRDSGRPGDRRAAPDGADVRHRAGRGSLRGDDGGRSLSAATTC